MCKPFLRNITLESSSLFTNRKFRQVLFSTTTPKIIFVKLSEKYSLRIRVGNSWLVKMRHGYAYLNQTRSFKNFLKWNIQEQVNYSFQISDFKQKWLCENCIWFLIKVHMVVKKDFCYN